MVGFFSIIGILINSLNYKLVKILLFKKEVFKEKY
jgi:hypothetical protein